VRRAGALLLKRRLRRARSASLIEWSAMNKKKSKGLTIVQTMLIVLVAGIAIAIVTDFIIDKRCEAEPARAMCSGR
jgi:hypothetical protein